MIKTGDFHVVYTSLPEHMAFHDIATTEKLAKEILLTKMHDQLFDSLSDGRAYTIKVFDMTHVEDYYHVYAIDALCVLNDKNEAEIDDYVWMLEVNDPNATESKMPMVLYNERTLNANIFHNVFFRLGGKVFSSWKRIA